MSLQLLFSQMKMHLPAKPQRVLEIAMFLPTPVKKKAEPICSSQVYRVIYKISESWKPSTWVFLVLSHNMFLTQPLASVDLHLPVIILFLA